MVLVLVVLAMIASSGPRLGAGPAALAQSSAPASDLAAGFPEGITLTSLVEGIVNDAPDVPANLRLDRTTLGAGWESGDLVATGPLLFFIETGELTIVDELGIEGVYPANTRLIVPMGAAYTLRNDATAETTFLSLALLPASEEPGLFGTSFTEEGASSIPRATPEISQATTIPLLRADIAADPVSPAHLFLVQLTWEPGAMLPEHVFNGPAGFVGMQGELTVAGPSGIEGQIGVGDGVMFPAGLPNRARNAGTEPAVVLLAGLVGADEPLIATTGGATPAAELSTGATPVVDTPTPTATEPAVAAPADVPLFRGNAARTGEMPGPGPEGAPTLRWRVNIGAVVRTSPAVVDGIVYVGDLSGKFQALDAATGDPIWDVDTGGLVMSSPAVVDGIVYFGSDDGNLYARDAATGTQRWTFETSNDVRSSPVVAGGMVYFGSLDRHLYALNAVTGEEAWSVETSGPIHASPAVAGGVIYIESRSGGVTSPGVMYALDAATGAERWTFEIGEGTTTPAVLDGTVFVVNGNGILHALDTATGTERWRFDLMSESFSSPAVANGVVYVGGHDGIVRAFAAADGSEIWRFNANGEVRSSPVIVGASIYVNSDSGFVYAIDAANGLERWRFETDDRFISSTFLSSPSVVDGIVYVGSYDRHLYAIGGDAGFNQVTPTPIPLTEGASAEVTTEGAVLRAAPSTAGVVVAELPVGSRVTVTGPSERREGMVWWLVEDEATGATGYISADFLTAA